MVRSAPLPREKYLTMARWAVLAAMALLAGFGVARVAPAFDQGLSVRAIEDIILSWGTWGVIASLGVMVAHSFVPFPAEFVAFANGMVYGPVWGTVITWTGAMLGAFCAFGLARAFGRPFVAMLVARRNWHVLDEWAATRGAYVVLVSRFIPVISFNLINYAAGLTRISWWTFAWTTGVGILPLTTLMVVMGHRIESLGFETWLLLGAGGIGLWWVVRRKLQPLRMTASLTDHPRGSTGPCRRS